MSMLKVTVSGMVSEVFIGNAAAAEKYLQMLKKQQESLVNVDDMNFYIKEMPKYKSDFIISNQKYSWSGGNKYNFYSAKYLSPSPDMEQFRSKYHKNGLKIKIEPFIEEQTHDFF